MSKKNKGFKIGDRVVYKNRLGTIINIEYQVCGCGEFHLYKVPVSYEVVFDDNASKFVIYDNQLLKYADKIIFVLGQNGIHGSYISGDKRIKDVDTDYKLGDLKGTLHKALNALLDSGFMQTAIIRYPEVIDIFNKETSSHINTVLSSMTKEQREVVNLLIVSALANRTKREED